MVLGAEAADDGAIGVNVGVVGDAGIADGIAEVAGVGLIGEAAGDGGVAAEVEDVGLVAAAAKTPEPKETVNKANQPANFFMAISFRATFLIRLGWL